MPDLVDKVIIYHDLCYEQLKLESKVLQGLKELQLIGQEIKAGMRVLVKPNLLAAVPPERRVTTHPVLISAIVATLVRMGCSVIVSDSSGGGMHGYAQTNRALNVTGIADAAVANGATVEPLEKFGAKPRIGKLGNWTLWLSPLLDQVDIVINVPVLKTHTATIITGAVKNLFGLTPGHLKAQYHRQLPHIPTFSSFLVDLALAVRPTVTIVDAIVCMHGNGPMNGSPYSAGKLVMGRNPFTVDFVLASLVGLPPREIPTVDAAFRAGISHHSLFELLGEAVPVLPNFRLPKTVHNDWISRHFFKTGIRWRRVNPIIDTSKCQSCGQCYGTCPVNAIKRNNNHFWMEKNKCINCLCCYELCPSNAIVLKRNNMLHRIYSSFIYDSHGLCTEIKR